MSRYKELIVWQKAVELARAVYILTNDFSKEELYGLTSQMRRCAVSIPSNIAEGSKRNTQKDFRQFSAVASGSTAELETQTELVKSFSFGNKEVYEKIEKLLLEITKILTTMITKD